MLYSICNENYHYYGWRDIAFYWLSLMSWCAISASLNLCCSNYRCFLLQSVILTIFLQRTEWYVWPQGESFYNPYIPGVIEKLDKLGLVEDSDGARVIYVEGVNIPIIAVKRDGGYNYFSTDLASLWLVFFLQVFCTYFWVIKLCY